MFAEKTLYIKLKNLFIRLEAFFLIFNCLYFLISFYFYLDGWNEFLQYNTFLKIFVVFFYIFTLVLFYQFHKKKLKDLQKNLENKEFLFNNPNPITIETKENLKFLKSFDYVIHLDKWFFIISYFRFLGIFLIDILCYIYIQKNNLYLPYLLNFFLIISGFYFILQQNFVTKLVDGLISQTKFFGLPLEVIKYPKLRTRLFFQLFISLHFLAGIIGFLGYQFSKSHGIEDLSKEFKRKVNLILSIYQEIDSLDKFNLIIKDS
jgi:hypothetical protein